MKAVVAAFNQEKALVGAFSVIVQPLVEPMDRFTALPRSGYSDIIQLAAYTTPRVVLSEEKTAAKYRTHYSPLTLFLLVSEFIPWRNLHTQSQSAH